MSDDETRAATQPTIEEDIATRDALKAARDAVQNLLEPVFERLRLAGVEVHPHGAFNYEDPGWWHAHPHEGDHEHPPEEAPKDRWDSLP